MLRFAVYDKTRARKGWVQASTDPTRPQLVEATAQARHLLPSNATFTVDADHHLAAALGAPGARCLVEYRPIGTTSWIRLFSGPVTEVTGGGYPERRTFTVGDDKEEVLRNLIGWAAPDRSIAQQGDEGTHWRASGPAETVVKQLITANAHRHHQPITVAPNQDRGATITVSVRFTRLDDVLLNLLDGAGLGVTVLQADDGTTLVVDVYEKRVHTVPLSDRSGVIRTETGTSWAVRRPTVTRVIVGAGGQDEARFFREYIDHAREEEWGTTIEVFRDARDIKPDLTKEPDRDALMAERAAETLAEGAGTASLSLTLAETEHFRFGQAVLLGDIVQATVAGSPLLTDTVTEVEIRQTESDGVLVTPKVGDRTSDPDNPDAALAAALAAVARSVRDLKAGM